MTVKRVLVALALVVASCRADRERELTSIAVLPLSNASADPLESDYLADGITQAVITRLAQVGLRVTPWESVRRYRGSEAEPQAIARELKVDAVLLGTFQLAGDRILTRLTLVEAESGFIAWAEELENPYEDLFQVQRRIAQGAASSLKRSLSGEEKQLLAAPESRSVEAYALYLQGAHLMQEGTREATEVAFEYFSRAAELDPNLVGAYLGLGAVHNVRYFHGWGNGPSSLEQAASSYEKALALDLKSMVARRGLVMMHFFRGESEAVLAQGKLARRTETAEDPETLLTRALAYHYGGLAGLSLDLYRRAIEIDPAHPEARFQLTSALSFLGDSERAVEAGTEFLRRFGDDNDTHCHVAIAYWRLGDDEHAREHFLKATRGEGHPWIYRAAGAFFDMRGERERAVELWKAGAAAIESNLAVNPDHVGMRAFLSAFRALLGRDPSLLEDAERAYQAAGYYGWELENLMMTKVKLGDLEGAIEILRERVRHGRPIIYWDKELASASLTPTQSETLRQLLAENEALKARYRERFRIDEPGK